ncbi:MAG TPA: VWA domain-containing protein [Terriglobia bacterium]|nr:VWA domain-containing protein [Terriglobia bacterium]
MLRLSKVRINFWAALPAAAAPVRVGALLAAWALAASAAVAQQPAAPGAAGATEAPVPAGGQAPTVEKKPGGGFEIRHEVALVVLRATVVDKKGRMINDLARDDFKVFENSVAQKLAVFSHADIPVTLGIVIDDSGSMKEKRPAVNASALAFVQTSNPQDQVFIVNFNDVAYIDTPGDFATNMEDLRSALDKIDSRGGTALYDAISTSLDHLRLGNRDKKVLLVITDGVDNESRYSLDELLKYAQESNAVIYTIGLLGGEENTGGLFKIKGSGDRKAAKALEQLAHATGGEAYFPKSLAQVQETCGQVAHDIRNQYTLAYYPTNKAADGTFRIVRVDAFEHGTRKKLIVRTRPGYYAPKPGALSAEAAPAR